MMAQIAEFGLKKIRSRFERIARNNNKLLFLSKAKGGEVEEEGGVILYLSEVLLTENCI